MSRSRRALWVAYKQAMLAARQACFALADAIEGYLRIDPRAQMFRGHELLFKPTWRYRETTRLAAQYHLAAMPSVPLGLGINETNEELLELMRELRGTPIAKVTRDGRRRLIRFVYADDGCAGFFAVELRSMRRFRKPVEAVREDRFAASERRWS